jgi:glycosyltransferase involved in cell wall biosynthesis
MKIGVNTLFMIPGEVGGTETYLNECLKAILDLDTGIRLSLFTTRDNDEALRHVLAGRDGVDFHRLNFSATRRPVRILREQTELPRLAGRTGVEVLWSPGYTAPLFGPCPQVVTVHDMQYKTYPEDLSLPARLATDVLVRAAVRRCRAVVTDSRFSKGEILRFTAAREDRVHVVPLGVDPAFRADAGKQQEGGHPLGDRPAPYILNVANSYPHKNIHTLVEAYGRIQADLPHHLVLVGRPRRGQADLDRALARLEDPGRVVRFSYLDPEPLRRLFREADVFVFPSLYEGFGLPVLEAMMSGAPVITSDHGAIPEIGGQHVVYAEAKDIRRLSECMRKVLNWDEAERVSRVQAARAHARAFTWKKTAENLLSVFAAVPGVSGF